jgi:hypothetical protein
MDENGAFFLIAVPQNWNRRLVLWNHGYTLDPPAALRLNDLGPAGVLLGQGFAAAASSYRPDPVGRGGWAVLDGAIDTENLRQRFVKLVDQPDQTFLVGASEGGIITATMMELFGVDENGNLNYDGAMPMCGPLAGGRRSWYGGLDLRVVYQYYCQNLPRPTERRYPLWFGLDPMTPLTQEQLGQRVNECTGVSLPRERTPEQQRKLDNILHVAKIPEGFLLTDMGFVTFALQELTLVRTNGQNPLTNIGVYYTGSDDDETLNAQVERYASDPDAVDFLVSAYDPQGTVAAPILTIHTIGDGLVIVENEQAYLETLQEAGTDDLLQQNYVNDDRHCGFSNAEVQSAFVSLLNWVNTGTRPTRESVAGLCSRLDPTGAQCRFNLRFTPDPFDKRVAPREP